MNEGEVCESNDANHCADKVCQSGACVFDPSFFDGHFCQVKTLCQSYQCTTGVCNTSYIVQLPEGTPCIESPFTCRQWTCDALGNCQQSVGDGVYCYTPEETFRRDGSASGSSNELPECHAYQCDSGACTSTIVETTGLSCERNYTSACIDALCIEGVCSPVLVDGCDECSFFQDCDSCLTGTFKRDEVSSTGPSSANGCVWCRNKCMGEDLYLELVNITSADLACSADLAVCPLAPTDDSGGSDHTVAIIAGTLGGAAGLALLAAAAAGAAAIIKKRHDLAKKFPTVGSPFAQGQGNNNPIHTPQNNIGQNAAFTGQ
jgi:hypothetical protein